MAAAIQRGMRVEHLNAITLPLGAVAEVEVLVATKWPRVTDAERADSVTDSATSIAELLCHRPVLYYGHFGRSVLLSCSVACLERVL